MKILLYCINYYPEKIGCGKYNKKLRDILIGMGYDVEVITSVPYYPEWKLIYPFRVNWYLFKNKITRCPIYIPSKINFVTRIIYTFSFLISSLPIVMMKLINPPKIIIIIQPSILTVIPALILKYLSKTKIWMHIQDLEIEAAVSNGYIKKNILIKTIEKFIYRIYRRIDVITVVSKSMKNYLENNGIKSVYMPNWPDSTKICNKFDAIDKISCEIDRDIFYNKKNKFILYSGNIGLKQNLEDFIGLFNSIDSDYTFLIICGDGINKKNIIDLTRHNKKIINIGTLSNYNYNLLMSICDFHLLPVNNMNNEFMLPSKLIQMIKYNKCIISNANLSTEIGQIVNNYSGLLIDFNLNSNTILFDYINNYRPKIETSNLDNACTFSSGTIKIVIGDIIKFLNV